MVLIPQVADAIKIPVIAAGGIIDGRGMAAAFCLGAQGVQMGTRFVASLESSAHENFRNAIIHSNPSSTMLVMKKHVPVRLLKNKFYEGIKKLEDEGASEEKLIQELGKGRARQGMLEGNLEEGELEIGQGCSMVRKVQSVEHIVNEVVNEYQKIIKGA
jgi:enoyl-[acyl-carrier protein] reductase II